MKIFGFGRVKRLEKRLKALEDFLGLIHDGDEEYPDYDFKASTYDGKPIGMLAKLMADYAAKRKGK